MSMEFEKFFRHGTKSSDIYSFTQLDGTTATGLIDFSCRITWSVTRIPDLDTKPNRRDNCKPRWERTVYGCNCNTVPVPKTFSPVLVYSESSRQNSQGLQISTKNKIAFNKFTNETPELRQRLLNSQFYQGANLYYSRDTTLNYFRTISGDKDIENTQVNTQEKKSRKYKCQFCNVTCTNNGQLRGHLRVHTGEKPYRCDHLNCDKSFARNEELTRHRRIHSGIRPHHCLTCGKYFGRKDHLNKHLKTHLKTADKKNYVCVVTGCGQRYTRSDALARHQWSTHNIKPKTTKWKQSYQ